MKTYAKDGGFVCKHNGLESFGATRAEARLKMHLKTNAALRASAGAAKEKARADYRAEGTCRNPYRRYKNPAEFLAYNEEAWKLEMGEMMGVYV